MSGEPDDLTIVRRDSAMASRHKQLAAGIIAAILASDVVLAAADLPYAPSIISLFVTAYLSAQIGLHSVWIAIGRASWLVRFCTLFPVWVGIWLYLNAWTYMAMHELSLVCLAQAVVTAVCLLAISTDYRCRATTRSGRAGIRRSVFDSRFDDRNRAVRHRYRRVDAVTVVGNGVRSAHQIGRIWHLHRRRDADERGGSAEHAPKPFSRPVSIYHQLHAWGRIRNGSGSFPVDAFGGLARWNHAIVADFSPGPSQNRISLSTEDRASSSGGLGACGATTVLGHSQPSTSH